MQTNKYIFISIILLLHLTGKGAFADSSCLDENCHKGTAVKRYVHPPVAREECTVICHRPHKNYIEIKGVPVPHKDIRGVLSSDLCKQCHAESVAKMFQHEYLHGPVDMGDCIACHNPHQSDYRFLLQKPTVMDLCFSCHENKYTFKKFTHRPVADGNCLGCHYAHASKHKLMLKEEGNALCLMCHGDIEWFTESIRAHKSFQEPCGFCHYSHSSDRRFLLKSDLYTGH